MEEKSRIAQMMDSAGEWLNEQDWFQQIKAKWEELDPQSRMYLQFATAGLGVCAVGFMLISFMWSVHKSKQEVAEKSEILSTIQAANDELRSLRDLNANVAGGDGQVLEPWAAYFENTAAGAGIAKGSVSVSEPKSGASSEVSKETLFDLSMKKINVRQAVRLAQSLESGARPVKLRNLVIDTQPDGSGYLDVTLSVSAFSLVPKQ